MKELGEDMNTGGKEATEGEGEELGVGRRRRGEEEEEQQEAEEGAEKRKSCAGEATLRNGSSSARGERQRKQLRIQEGREDRLNGSRTPPVGPDSLPRSPRLDGGGGGGGGGGRRRKLVLHVDLRNTILVADSVTNVAVEQALNSFLTGATWGQELEGRWQWHTDRPSLTAPAPGKITYYKFLERQLVRTPSERTALRLATGDFTSTPIGTIFRPHFQRHLHSLKWNYPAASSSAAGGGGEHQPLTMAGSDGQLYHYIVEGLYRLLHHLVDTRRDFALVLRTYGLDAPNTLSSLAHGLKGHHPGFPRALHVPVNRATGSIRRVKDAAGGVLLEAFRPDSPQELLVKLTHERDIYRFLSRAQVGEGGVGGVWVGGVGVGGVCG